MIELNKIYEEDCLETMLRIPDCFVDMTITSPPYDDMREYDGNNNIQFKKIAKSLYRITKKGGVVVWIIGDQTKNWNESGTSFMQCLYFKETGFNLFDTMIYLKKPRGACGNNQSYWQTFEYMFVLSKGRPNTINLIYDRENKDVRSGDNGTKRLYNGTLLNHKRGGYSKLGRRTNVWEYTVGKGHSTKDNIAFKHPAIYPEKLVDDHLTSWTNKEDIVYDPFIGSGTTAKVCKIKGRNYIGSEINKEYVKDAMGLPNLFSSHMFDGSELPLQENIKFSKEYLAELASMEMMLELEIGVVGGEEDGINNEDAPAEKLYTSPTEMLYVYEEMKDIKDARYILAATFGNVHGVYKPGNVKLNPKILKNGQEKVMEKYGEASKMDLVFHGGSGSSQAEIHETLNYGVVKMNVDTDTQYAYSRPIADHMLKNYDGVLKIDSEVGNKKFYDPRSYLKAAEKNMSQRVVEACEDLKSKGRSLF